METFFFSNQIEKEATKGVYEKEENVKDYSVTPVNTLSSITINSMGNQILDTCTCIGKANNTCFCNNLKRYIFNPHLIS